MTTNPALQRYRLRTELKKARTAVPLTQREVADYLDWSASKVIRIESGDVGVSSTDLKALVDRYGIQEKYGELVELAKGSRKQPWAEYRDLLSPETIKFFGFEASATIIRSCQNSIIPGLLQTQDYTRALLTKAYGLSVAQAERHIDVRRERQELLVPTPASPKAFFVLDEAVLRRIVGGVTVMRRQLERLEELAERPRVTIQVLPLSVDANFAMRGPFVYLEFADRDDPDVLYLENARGEQVFRNVKETTEPYRRGFQSLEDLASDPEQISEQVKNAIRDIGR